MATATLLSFTDAQKQSILPRATWPTLRKSASSVRCYQIGRLPSNPDPDASTRTSSRRDTIALLLQGAFLCVANSTARAVEGNYEGSNDSEHAQTKNGLDLRVSVHVNRAPLWIGKLTLGKLAGTVLAYQRHQRSTDSSLGILGCLVFGLLFLKEKQSRTACNSSLEDIQSRNRQADIELLSQTRSAVGYKLEEIQLEIGLETDGSSNGVLQGQLVNTRSSIMDRETQLTVKKDLTKMLKNQLNGLATLVKEAEGDCSVLLGLVVKQLHFQQQLEGELHSTDADIQSKAKSIDSLTLSAVNQDEANKQMVKKLLEAENSLDEVNKQVLDAEKTAERLKHSLLVNDGLAESLVVDLQRMDAKTKTSEAELHDLRTCLECEQAAFVRRLAERNEVLALKMKEADADSAELSGLQDEIEGHERMVNGLTSERDGLSITVRKRKVDVESFMEKIRMNQESLKAFNYEVATLHEQLSYEQARRTALESDLENNDLLGLFSKVSSEVENQIKEQKDMAYLLEEELRKTNQAWSESKAEVSQLRGATELLSSSQVQLQEEMAKLSEDKQALSITLKKEKRAVAYVKKQLALSKEIFAKESQVMEELCNELEKVRRLVADAKEQISVKALEMKRASETEDHLIVDAVQMKPTSSDEEQALQMNYCGDDDVAASVGKHRRKSTKQTTTKVQRSSRKSVS